MRFRTTLRTLRAVAVLAALVVPAVWAETPAEFVFVPNFASDTVSAFRQDAATGALTEVTGSPFATGDRPLAAAVHPTNRFLYVVNDNDDVGTLSAFAIGAGGELTPVPGSPFFGNPPAGLADLTAVAVDPSGRFLYATDALYEKVRGYVIDPLTGGLTGMAGSPFALGNNAGAVSVHPSGQLLYAAANSGIGGDYAVFAYSIDPATGALAPLAGTPVAAGDWPQSSAVDPSGRFLYVANGASDDVSAYALHPLGVPIPLGGSPFAAGSFATQVAVTPSGQFAYVANWSSDYISAYALDGATGDLTPLTGAPFPAPGGRTGLVIDATGLFLYTSGFSSNAVFGYRVGPDGGLTSLPGSPYPAGAGPDGVAATNHDPLFKDGFESGDGGAWSLPSTDGGDLSVSAEAALHGTRGLSALVDDTAPLFVSDDSPQDEDRYRARFLFDPRTFDPGVSLGHFRARILIGFRESPSQRVVTLVLKLRNGQYSVAARMLQDDGTRADTPFVPISSAAHALQIDWRRATSAGASDGSLELFVDDASVARLTGMDNDAAGIDFVRLGAMSLKPGASGNLFFDRFESRRYNFIWP